MTRKVLETKVAKFIDCAEEMHLFQCPTCKVQGYCDGGGFCLHETHSLK